MGEPEIDTQNHSKKQDSQTYRDRVYRGNIVCFDYSND